MQRTFLKSKIHRATVTDANLNYEGSLTVDIELLERAKMNKLELVSVMNTNNGERFETYLIEGQRGKRDICLNGAAARKVQIGDKIIIMTYCLLDESEIESHLPTIILLDENNNIKQQTNKIIPKTIVV
ncbi:MAG: aspartate 1-decarboxylase [Bacteroidetes bacterium]|nr:aspartate 1-decarboxylase [Bacteroidota bacterium]